LLQLQLFHICSSAAGTILVRPAQAAGFVGAVQQEWAPTTGRLSQSQEKLGELTAIN